MSTCWSRRRGRTIHTIALPQPADDALDACAQGDRFTLLPIVAAGFLRVVTHPRVFRQPTPIDLALAYIEALSTTPGVSRIAHDREWPAFLQLCRAHQLAGNDVPDAWIAAAVIERREILATFDRGFRRWLTGGRLVLLNQDR